MNVYEIRHSPRAAGALLGACIAVAAIVLALPGSGHGGILSATVDVSVRTSPTVVVAPAAPSLLLHAADLRPTAAAAGASFDLANQTGRPLRVGLGARTSSHELDRLVRVGITAGKETLAEGYLGDLTAGAIGSLVLGPGERRSIRVNVSIPADAASGYEGRRVALTLVPQGRGEAGR